jgi:hypothetical protein
MTKITSIIMGGLGNQLYIIFATIGYAKKHNIEYEFLKTDIVYGNRPSYWDIFLTNIPTVTEYSFHPKRINLPGFVNDYMELPYSETESYEFNHLFQSYLYFDFMYEKMRNMIFSCKAEILDEVNKEYENIIQQKISDDQPFIFMHIRRTDYLSDPATFIVLDMNYYRKAITYFPENTHYVIFSEDIDYCLQNFDFIESKSFVQNKDYIELLLMSKMDGAIIANSTFSCWGAYLMDKDKNKTVVAPNYWLQPTRNMENPNNLRLYPNWIKLDNLNECMPEILS